MSDPLVTQLLDHHAPERVLSEVRTALDAEKKARRAFRRWLKPGVGAEFISGEIVMRSPAKRRHSQAVKSVSSLLDFYVSRHDLGEVAVGQALVETERNDFVPDICLWLKETSNLFTDEMDIYPPPNLVVEVLSRSTADFDRGVKKKSYESEQVREYWIVDPVARTVEQYVLGKNKHGNLVYTLRETYGVEQDLVGVLLADMRLPVRAFFDPERRDEAVRELLTRKN